MFANKESADADAGREGLDQQGDVRRSGEELVEEFDILGRQRESFPRVAAKVTDGIGGWRDARLPPLKGIVEGGAVFLAEQIRRPAAIGAGDGLEILHANDCGIAFLNGADQQAANLGAAFGNGAETAHNFGGQAIHHVQPQVNR